jgi:SAM-dependent methyltransferase
MSDPAGSKQRRGLFDRLPFLGGGRPTTFADYAAGDDYRGEVERSFNFMPVKHDLFMRAKAQVLLDVARARLGSLKALSVLDVGCGVGSMQALVRDHVGRSVGVDTSAESIAEGRRRAPQAELMVYDGQRLPFDNETFDVTFAVNVMHHVPPAQWPAFAAELLRVVRPGGLAMVFEHNPYNPLTRLAVFRCAFDDDAVLLTRRRVTRLLRAAGGLVRERRYILFFPIDDARARGVERHLARLPLGAQHVVVAERT